jgi:hypothetical protein
MLVFGEWGGKSSSDYMRENVKVRSQREDLVPELQRHLDICRKIMGT